jgi:CSLREA domain-containing protein
MKPFTFCLRLAVIFVFILALAPSAAPVQAAVFVVNSPADIPLAPPNGVCGMGPGTCTLREAIQESDAAGGGNVIQVTVPVILNPALGPLTILSNGNSLAGLGMPSINGGIGGIPTLTITGSNNFVLGLVFIGAGTDAIYINGGSNNVVQGVMLLANLGGAGVHVSGGTSNVVTGNWIGIDGSDACAGNQYGVHVDGGAISTQITNNVISCNAKDGVFVDGLPVQNTDTVIEGNKIGTNAAGTAAKANQENGVQDEFSVHTIIRNNVISGNTLSGVRLKTAQVTMVHNNMIGVNTTGTAALANGGSGVVLLDGAGGCDVGGALDTDRNIISGNGGNGVWITNSSTGSNTVRHNYIGLNAAGTAAIGNALDGVRIDDAAGGSVQQNYIGGDDPTYDRNVISGNTLNGIYIYQANDNFIDSNYIGLDAAGTGAIPNLKAGIRVEECDGMTIATTPLVNTSAQFISGNVEEGILAVNSDDVYIGPANTIGVQADGISLLGNGRAGVRAMNSRVMVYAQVIAFNGFSNDTGGVVIVGASSLNNEIAPLTFDGALKQLIYANAGLPVDLGNDGATPNDVGDGDSGPNNLLNYPEITSASGTAISGTVCSGCTVLVYAALGNPAQNGGGGEYLMQTTAVGTAWSVTLLTGHTAATITLLAVDSTGNTSEMSPRPQYYLPLINKP